MQSLSAIFDLAFRHHRAGNLQKAQDLYCRILGQDPNHAEALHYLGLIAHQQGQHPHAVVLLRKAIAAGGGNAIAYSNLGAALMAVGQLAEATTCFRQALKLEPSSAESHNNLGVVLMQQGQLEEAVPYYREAIRLQADYALAHNNLGVALQDQGRFDEAVACHEQALRLQPTYAEAHYNLGYVLKQQGRPVEAARHYQEVVRLKPDFPNAHSDLLYCLNLDPQADPAAVFEAHRRWGSLHEQAATVLSAPLNDSNPERRLRVGYVSPDLRNHPVVRFFEPILTHHDPAIVETICYAEVGSPDAVTARLQGLAHGWRFTVGLSERQLADTVRGDGIDILVDLAGHTAHNRLGTFAYKPAPVQVSYLGYPYTTGLRAIDYYLTDAVLDPPGETPRYTEELVRLPRGICCFAAPEQAPPVAPLPARRAGRITFGSLHRLEKLTPEVFEVWSQVLRAVPRAGLLLFWPTLHGPLRDRIRSQFIQRGVGGERLDLRHEPPPEGYLGIYGNIDIGLDVFPWTGATTTCESLWMGVPVLGLRGSRLASRGTAGLLTQIGLADLIADTPGKYVELAGRLAGDWERLARLRESLRRRMSETICDGKSFTRGLEEAYRTIWRRWCARDRGAINTLR